MLDRNVSSPDDRDAPRIGVFQYRARLIEDWPLWLLGAAVCYIFVVPVSNNFLLFGLFFCLAVISAINALARGIQIPRPMAVALCTWLLFLTIGVVTALAMDAESLLRTMVFLAVWPALFTTIVAGYTQRATEVMVHAGALATALISVTFISGALSATGRLPFNPIPNWFLDLIAFRYVADEYGIFALSAHSLPSLMWWTPMWIASLFVLRPPKFFPPLWVRWVLATLGTAAVVIAWRRAIVLVVLLTPAFIMAVLVVLIANKTVNFANIMGYARRVPIAAAAYIAGGVIALGAQPSLLVLVSRLGVSVTSVVGGRPPIDIEGAPPIAGDGVLDDDAIADSLRANELRALTSWDSPAELLVGRGFGATIDRGAIERDMSPWQTELQYHLIFYWTGLIGLVLLGAIITACAIGVIQAAKVHTAVNPALFVVTIGALAALAGNATNPYLQAPGHLWVAFWPVMIACTVLVQHNAGRPVRLTPALRKAPLVEGTRRELDT